MSGCTKKMFSVLMFVYMYSYEGHLAKYRFALIYPAYLLVIWRKLRSWKYQLYIVVSTLQNYMIIFSQTFFAKIELDLQDMWFNKTVPNDTYQAK